jgi:uncharacterized protein YaaW (UPF0174 family)
MFGIKLLITGLLAGHAFRAFTLIGSFGTATIVTIPSTVWSLVQTNYRKTIPVTLLLLLKVFLKWKEPNPFPR